MSELSAFFAEHNPDHSTQAHSTRDDLPAFEDAPILEPLQTLGGEAFQRQFAVATPLDRRGFVDHIALLDIVTQNVRDDYKWPNIDYDVHHLQWTAAMYTPAANHGSLIPMEFREIPFHKLYIPRQLHNFIHTITLPPDRPSFYAMWNRAKAYRRAEHLFNAALNSMHLEIAETVARPLRYNTVLIPSSAEFPEDWYLAAKTSRAIERDVLVDRYAEFTKIFEKQLEGISIRDLDGLIDLPQTLPTHEIISMMRKYLPLDRRKQASVKPDIPVDTQQPTHRAIRGAAYHPA